MKKLLGDHQITIRTFDGLDALMKKFKKLKDLPDRRKSDAVNEALLELIQKEEEPCFLLPAVLQFIRLVDEEKILPHYVFTSFETWLNHNSGLDFEENSRVRGKIAGKWVARGDYQNLFPIGMGKIYEGTHFVTAHKSPDLDTTIASFWGWLDAFAARVGDGLHIWNLPGGPPPSQIEVEWIFKDLFGEAVFTHLPKTRLSLDLTGNDLMSARGLHRKTFTDSIADIDHDRDMKAVVIVDAQGFYLGDWRVSDVEGVRQVILSLGSCLRWFENTLQMDLISFFAKETVTLNDIRPVLKALLDKKLRDAEPAKEFTFKQSRQVDDFLKSVLKMKHGLSSNFGDLASTLCELSAVPFGGVEHLIGKMKKAGLFDAKGHLNDERPKLFAFLESIIRALHLGVVEIRNRLDKVDIALKTKVDVFGHLPTTVSIRSDIEEIQSKMGHHSHLTVVYPDEGGAYPVGVIQSADLRKPILGTVSLRDFCNREEMGIPHYLEVISVIDHHKSALNTFTPPMAILSDVQSSNTLVAQKAFEINDLYKSLKKGSYFIHPEREFIEYLHFLYGIIDDTDLLSKVSRIDVECAAMLLNRLKSLSLGKKVEMIDFDGLDRDRTFAKKGAARILQNDDMYSLYSRVYKFREKEVATNLTLCAKGEPSNLFADTKEQNGCCRVGQTKVFSTNIASFEKHVSDIRRVWLQKARNVHKERPEIDLHIHMISTIVDAEEVYKGTVGKYKHQDELWIWMPETDVAMEHLKRFLSAFQRSPGLRDNPVEVEFTGANTDALEEIFDETFVEIGKKRSKRDLPIAILRYRAGSLNSRKAMVSPFLPTLS